MGAPIYGFVGPNGGGKTLAVMELVVRPALEAGRPVVSTCYVEGGIALESVRQLPLVQGGVLVFDEISSCFPSRSSSTMPEEILRFLNQLRKVDIQVAWTGPSWNRADKVLREVTDEVTVCRGFLDGRKRAERRAVGASAWPQHRLFRWNTYAVTLGDSFKVEDSTRDDKSKLKAKRSQWYRRPAEGGAQSLYRTLDKVLLLDHLDSYGNCFACGGTRRRPACKCEGARKTPPPPLRTWADVEVGG